MSALTVARLALAGFLGVAALAVATPVRAETWCLRSHGSGSGTCVFQSARDCTMAATYSAFGGVCERQGFEERSKADKRRADRKRANQPDRWWR